MLRLLELSLRIPCQRWRSKISTWFLQWVSCCFHLLRISSCLHSYGNKHSERTLCCCTADAYGASVPWCAPEQLLGDPCTPPPTSSPWESSCGSCALDSSLAGGEISERWSHPKRLQRPLCSFSRAACSSSQSCAHQPQKRTTLLLQLPLAAAQNRLSALQRLILSRSFGQPLTYLSHLRCFICNTLETT